jgi:hypothetical protein
MNSADCECACCAVSLDRLPFDCDDRYTESQALEPLCRAYEDTVSTGVLRRVIIKHLKTLRGLAWIAIWLLGYTHGGSHELLGCA